MSNLIHKLTKWVKENKIEFAIVALILLIGAILRLYRIEGYMTFLGDEGRDAVVVRKLLVAADPILVGPGTSIGNMYLGPLYYYLIAPALLLANFSPVGPSVLIAVIGVVTIGMIYFIGKEWFGKIAGYVAAFLYAISPTVVIYSRASWNPNVMPFFALLCIYSIWRVWQKQEYKWLVVLGISFAFALNSHYLGLILAPVLGLFWLLTYVKEKINRKIFVKNSIMGLAVFLFLMSPLVIFDARHGWNNFNSIKTFFTMREQTVSIKPWKSIPNLWPIYQEYTTRLIGGRDLNAGWIAAFGIFDTFVVYYIFRHKKLSKNEKAAYGLIAVWLLAATVGLGLYKQHVYDHYYGFFFPAPFLLVGALIEKMTESKKKVFTLIAVVFTVGLCIPSITNSPLKDAPNMQLKRAREVSQKVIEISNGEPFNFALIAERNYEAGYRYFLDVYKGNVKDIDPGNTSDTITSQLIVVCEDPKEKCDPTHSPKAEVANFGWTKIQEEHDLWGITIYKLVHTQ